MMLRSLRDRDYFVKLMKDNNYNTAEVARIYGISRQAVQWYMKKNDVKLQSVLVDKTSGQVL